MANDIVDMEDEGPTSDSLVTGLVVFTTIALFAGLFIVLTAHKDNYGGGWLGG